MKKILNALIFSTLLFSKVVAEDHFLSFIVPCYNCEQWIEETVESIYQQSNLRCPFEVVCTDDGSSDNTFAVLQELKQRFPEMRLFRHLRNQGGSLARNTCVYKSQGDLIFCLDSDNVLCPDSVQGHIDKLDETAADVVSFGGLKYFDVNFNELGSFQYSTPDGYYHLQDVLNDQNTPPWSGNYLYRVSSFDRAGGYPPRLTTDTFSFGFRQVLTGSKFTYVPGTFYWHRVGIDSYYTRESRTNRIGIDFFDTILSIRDLIADDSANFIVEQREKAIDGQRYVDQIEILATGKIKLKGDEYQQIP